MVSQQNISEIQTDENDIVRTHEVVAEMTTQMGPDWWSEYYASVVSSVFQRRPTGRESGNHRRSSDRDGRSIQR